MSALGESAAGIRYHGVHTLRAALSTTRLVGLSELYTAFERLYNSSRWFAAHTQGQMTARIA